MTGFQDGTAPAVIVMPADDDYNTGIMDAMFRKLREGCDIVAARRFMPGGCMEGCRRQKAVLVQASAFAVPSGSVTYP